MSKKADTPMTKGDLQTILDHITDETKSVENYVHEELIKVNDKMDALQKGVSNLRTGMTQVKKDVSELKTDVNQLKSDMKQVKNDVEIVASDLGYKRDAKKTLKSA